MIQSEISQPCRGGHREATCEIPRPCQAKRNSRGNFLGPGEAPPGSLQRCLGPAKGKGAMARAPQGAYRQDPSALLSGKESQSEILQPRRGRPRRPRGKIPRTYRAKLVSIVILIRPSEGAPGGLHSRSLGLAERKGVWRGCPRAPTGIPEHDSWALARATQGAFRRVPLALPSEKELKREIPRRWRGRHRGPTGEIPRPCHAKREGRGGESLG